MFFLINVNSFSQHGNMKETYNSPSVRGYVDNVHRQFPSSSKCLSYEYKDRHRSIRFTKNPVA